MEELRRLEEVQRTLTLVRTTEYEDCNCFVSKLTLLLVQPCGQLDLEKKCALVSGYMPKISAALLDEASGKGGEDNYVESIPLSDCGPKSNNGLLQTSFEEIAMVGLHAMQRANSTLEDFCRSYFMFHGMDINKPQSVFKYLPMLSFTESFIYQLDDLNEKTLQTSNSRMSISESGEISQSSNVFKSYPFRPLECLLESHGLLSERMKDEFKSGEEYWALERKLCQALTKKLQISVKDVIKAINLKSFDYRVLNLLLYGLRGEKINELHMEFLSVSEFLVEVADDLQAHCQYQVPSELTESCCRFDYEEDVLENNFNTLRMFVRIFGTSATTVLAKYIAEAEEKYNQVLKALDPQLSMSYQRRCVEATEEGGNASGHPLGTWNVPPLILDEEFYRSSLLDTK